MKAVTIGQQIKYWRNERGLTQRQLADMLGLTQAAVGLYELDQRQPPYAVMKAIARALGVTLADLDPEAAPPKSGLSTEDALALAS